MVGHWWLFGRIQKVPKKSEMFSAPSYKMGKFFLAVTKNICGWGEYIPWKIMIQIQTTKKFLGSGNKREKHTKSFFCLFEICIHYVLYREFSSLTWKNHPHPGLELRDLGSWITNHFLGGAPTSICHFFCPSAHLTVPHHISGTIHHLIIVYVCVNWWYLQVVFSFFFSFDFLGY